MSVAVLEPRGNEGKASPKGKIREQGTKTRTNERKKNGRKWETRRDAFNGVKLIVH